MQLEYRALENAFVRLEPLAEHHREGLRAACEADPAIWRELYPFSMLGPAFDERWARFMDDRAAGTWLPYAVMSDGVCGGMSSFIRPDAGHQSVEIGGTYYRPDLRGGAVNPAAKRLLMEHAFQCGAHRVQYRVDAINLRSRAAVKKLGASEEGVLRGDMLTWTGRRRDTAVYSVLADEWPAVRDRLDARLATFGG